MIRYDDETRLDAYEIVEQFWPYDGPYSEEHTSAAAMMIGRLGRYLNNATQKRGGLPYAAVAGRVLGELRDAVAGSEQLIVQLARFLDAEAETNPSLYDDRRDRPGAATAHQTAVALNDDVVPALRSLYAALAEPARLAYHLGSD